MRALPPVLQGDCHMNSPNAPYDTELLKLMFDAIDAARKDQQPCGDGIADRERGTAMAFQIMEAISAGERDPERLKFAALNATAGRSLDC
jgi:hypothetical protein